MSVKLNVLVDKKTCSNAEEIKTVIESVMLDLDPNRTQEEHKQYLAGYIDALLDTNRISDEVHEEIYVAYVS